LQSYKCIYIYIYIISTHTYIYIYALRQVRLCIYIYQVAKLLNLQGTAIMYGMSVWDPCMHLPIYIHVYIYMCVCVYIHIHICIFIPMYIAFSFLELGQLVFLRVHWQSRVICPSCRYTYIYIYICIYMHVKYILLFFFFGLACGQHVQIIPFTLLPLIWASYAFF